MTTNLHLTLLGTLTSAALLAFATTSPAQVFTETGDAGETLATAETAGNVATIYGTLSGDDDADLYKITITSPSTFSASTDNAVTIAGNQGPDTELFLFDSSGHAIEANDDNPNGKTITSLLPAGDMLVANLQPGVYYLGISASGDEPVNGPSMTNPVPPNQELFAPDDTTTDVRGPASGLPSDSTTLYAFNHNEYGGAAGTGAYEIDITGSAATPEPSTWSALAIGGGLWLAIAFLRRRPRVS